MEKYAKKLTVKGLRQHISKGSGTVTRSTLHGEFDNDVYTMNSVMNKILKQDVDKPFTKAELHY